MKKREIKDLLYEQVARVGRALSSPKRLELLELLAQGEKTVEALAGEAAIGIKLASAHLKALREARLVATRREGKYMVYRLSGHDVSALWIALRGVAEEHLVELKLALEGIVAAPAKLTTVDRIHLLDQVHRGEVVVIDVRPEDEFRAGHLPFARSMPVPEIERRIAELPPDAEIVAYCRGPFCLLSDEAVKLLAAHGYRARKLFEGVTDWRATGLSVASADRR